MFYKKYLIGIKSHIIATQTFRFCIVISNKTKHKLYRKIKM